MCNCIFQHDKFPDSSAKRFILQHPNRGMMNFKIEQELGLRIKSNAIVGIYGGNSDFPPNITHFKWLKIIRDEAVNITFRPSAIRYISTNHSFCCQGFSQMIPPNSFVHMFCHNPECHVMVEVSDQVEDVDGNECSNRVEESLPLALPLKDDNKAVVLFPTTQEVKQKCDSRCFEHGSCDNGNCTCSIGWNGKHCTIQGCHMGCHGNGECVREEDKWQCQCNTGWEGKDCSFATELICDDGLDNDGGKICFF